MGDMVTEERDASIDLESGGTISEEVGSKDMVLGITQVKRLLGRAWNGPTGFDGLVRGEESPNTCNGVLNSAEVSVENLESKGDTKLEGEEKVSLIEKGVGKEKPRKKSGKKAPKPPRPPKSPVLDAADQKLVREITELAMLKRARTERMKALKKMKAAKATSSSNSNMFAMVITIVFCLIIILQGAFSRGSSNLNFQGSPESAVAMRGGLISIHYNKNAPASSTNAPGSGSQFPNNVEQASGQGSQEEGNRAPG